MIKKLTLHQIKIKNEINKICGVWNEQNGIRSYKNDAAGQKSRNGNR